MFAFSGLRYTEGLSGSRHYTYDTPDSLEDVMAPGYLRQVSCLFAAGDSIDINAADGCHTFPITGPDYRDAPSALLH